MIEIPEFDDDGRARIRVSSLPGAADCFLRNATRAWPGLLETATGIALREVPKHVGALIGGAVHKGAERYLRTLLVKGELPADTDEAAISDATTAYGEEANKGAVLMDETTPHIGTAIDQMQRMLRAYRLAVLPGMTPLSVESRLEAQFDTDVTLSGQEDTFTLLPNTIEDLKAGKRRTNNAAQLGGYRLLRRSYKTTVQRLVENWIPRAPMSKPQPAPQRIEYDVPAAERMAFSTAHHITRQLREFRKTKDPSAFPANPQSTLCKDTFCRAWGTSMCSAWKGQ